MAKFCTIIADPPWFFRTKTDDGRIKCPDMHYSCMTLEDICALPVSAVAAENAALLIWTTWAHLQEAMMVIEAWGFIYRTGFPWIKTTRCAVPRRGIGYHVAQCSEPLLIATRGTGVSPCQDQKREVGIMFNQTGKHSAKPDEQYAVAERYPAPYLEMFARPDGGLFPLRQSLNWTQIGNEISGRSIEIDLCDLAADRPLPLLPHLRTGARDGEQSAVTTTISPTLTAPDIETPLTLF